MFNDKPLCLLIDGGLFPAGTRGEIVVGMPL